MLVVILPAEDMVVNSYYLRRNLIANEREALLAQLRQFCDEWEQLPTMAVPEPIQHAPLDPFLLSGFISSFQISIENVQATGLLANVWEVAGLKRNEVRIAGVLNWFLDPCESHGQKHKLCSSLLECISQNIRNETNIISMSQFPVSQNLCSKLGQARYRAVTEICPLGERESRVDIEINGECILLFIEVKIDAQQGESQLARYHNIAQIKSQGRPWGVIYLTPDGDLPEDAHALSNTISLSWGSVSDSLIQCGMSLKEGRISNEK